MATEGLASAVTGGGLAGQLPFLLLMLGIFTSRQDRMRALAACAGAIGLAHALFVSGSVIGAFWWGVLLVASLIMLGRVLLESSRVRFTPEEDGMLKGPFASLQRPQARHLLDQGFWLSGRSGDVLTREEEAVSHLFYLAAGEARVMSHGKQVGVCRAGDLIGEVSVLTGDQASATVVLSGPARFWCAPANVLRPYVETHEDVRRALETGFTASLRAKLRASNERMAESTSWRPPEGKFALSPTPPSGSSAGLQSGDE